MRTASRRILAGFFTLAGILHFVVPQRFEAIMPPWIPLHAEAVAVSGAAEIAGGLALLPERTRPAARWWLIALLIAVFPANVHMALHPEQAAAGDIPRWLLWARLPLQPLLGLWVWRATSESD